MFEGPIIKILIYLTMTIFERLLILFKITKSRKKLLNQNFIHLSIVKFQMFPTLFTFLKLLYK